MMHQAIRSVGAPRTAFLCLYLPPKLSQRTGGVRFRQSEPDNQDNMEKEIRIENPKTSFPEKDDMSSLGDAYATRSDDEGFGGIYGGNQYTGKYSDGENEVALENQNAKVQNQDYDRTQGSDVKEKEKARHQKEKGPDPSNAK